jgi:drug/metabolite transporter (DMT)-like permease
MQKEGKPAFVDWMVLVALMIVWGSSFILIKRGLISFSPVEVGALRISISFLFLLPFAISKIKKVPVNKLKLFLITGIVGNTFPAFLFAIAQLHIDSYLAGVLNSPTPLFTLLIGIAFFSVKGRLINIIGVIVGLVGAIGLLTSVQEANIGGNAVYGLLVIAATIFYATNINFVKKYLAAFDSLSITSISFATIGLPALAFLLFGTGFVGKLTSDPESYKSLLYIVVLAVVGTAMSMIAFNWLIKRVSALFASTVTYMMPIVSIVWGVIDGESFLLVYVLWILLILVGVFMSNTPASMWKKLAGQISSLLRLSKQR